MNVPQLRFKEFSGEWVACTIQHLVDNRIIDKPMDGNHGEIHPTSENYIDDGIPFIMANDIANGIVQIKKSKKISIEQANTLRKGFSYEGDILLTHKATIGSVAIVPKIDTPFLMLTPQVTYYRILNKEKLLNIFLKNYFESSFFQDEIYSLCTGATRMYIGISEQRKLRVRYCHIKEQTKIANFLTAIDERINQLTRKKELMTQYKQGVMQQIFSQQLRFKNDNGEDFADWEEKNANVLFESVSNKNHNSDLPILAITQEHGAIPRDLIDYQISVTDKSVETYKVVEIGDFIISLRSFQGGIEYSSYKGICSPAYLILRAKEELSSYFFKSYFKTPEYIKKLNQYIEGIRDGKMISYKQFSEVLLPLPSLEEQTKIANFLTVLDEKIQQISQQIEATKQYKQGLLQQMFV